MRYEAKIEGSLWRFDHTRDGDRDVLTVSVGDKSMRLVDTAEHPLDFGGLMPASWGLGGLVEFQARLRNNVAVVGSYSVNGDPKLLFAAYPVSMANDPGVVAGRDTVAQGIVSKYQADGLWILVLIAGGLAVFGGVLLSRSKR